MVNVNSRKTQIEIKPFIHPERNLHNATEHVKKQNTETIEHKQYVNYIIQGFYRLLRHTKITRRILVFDKNYLASTVLMKFNYHMILLD